MQRYLISQGYDIKADGEFGTKTYSALVMWQGGNGIKADGKYGTGSNGIAKIFNW
jgi:peptidoglycan hydrolase-like protein with peptidoglycan-binding domain